jgi:hypothetical protein
MRFQAVSFALTLACGTPQSASDASAPDASGDAASGADVAIAESGADAGDPVAKLLTLTSTCNQVSNGLYALNAGDTPTVPICSLTGALFWKADMDIDCDGKTTTQCSPSTDPSYQNQTAATDSKGNPLDAANLPYVVVPGTSTRYNFGANGLKLGDVILVLYNGQIEYAVYGDVGPSADIGEASYATAQALGVNPDPKVGGVDAPDVLYVAFPGAIVAPIEDHAQAVTVGQAALAKLIGP